MAKIRRPKGLGPTRQILGTRAKTNQAKRQTLQFDPRRHVHLASVEVPPRLSVAMSVHEDEHHRTLSQRHAAELPRAMGEQQSSTENPLDIDVVEAGSLDLEEFDASVGRSRPAGLELILPPKSTMASMPAIWGAAGWLRSKMRRLWRALTASITSVVQGEAIAATGWGRKRTSSRRIPSTPSRRGRCAICWQPAARNGSSPPARISEKPSSMAR